MTWPREETISPTPYWSLASEMVYCHPQAALNWTGLSQTGLGPGEGKTNLSPSLHPHLQHSIWPWQSNYSLYRCNQEMLILALVIWCLWNQRPFVKLRPKYFNQNAIKLCHFCLLTNIWHCRYTAIISSLTSKHSSIINWDSIKKHNWQIGTVLTY